MQKNLLDSPLFRLDTCHQPQLNHLIKGQRFSQVKTLPLINEYVVNIFEDEFYEGKYYLDDLVEDDETSEALIKAYSPLKDQAV